MHTKFAMEREKLFPLTNRAFTKVSVEMFITQADKIPVADQIKAMRKIASACDEFGLDDESVRDIKKRCGDALSSTFEFAMGLRKKAYIGSESSVDVLSKVGEKIARIQNQEERLAMLDKLAEEIDKLDLSMDGMNVEHIPNAIDTVFLEVESADDSLMTKKAFFTPGVTVGSRYITEDDLKRFDKKAAEGLIVPGVLLSLSSISEFAKASPDDQILLATFIP